MSFTSYEFLLVFFPAVLLLCWASFRHIRIQNVVLLAASVIFYACFDVRSLLPLALCTLITYAGGLLIHACRQDACSARLARVAYISALVLNFSILLVCKYTGFLLNNVNAVLAPFGKSISIPAILLPVGLSFFIFQSSSYLFDLWKGKLAEPERSLVRYGLFVSFFPSITSGPIQRGPALLPQIRKRALPTFARVQEAILIFLWGAFLKMVIADRLALFVDAVYGSISQYEGFVLIACAAAYSIQIYADFAGYSYMAIGVAALLGFSLPENFHQPYLAGSVASFWRRWHISLTSWLTEYLYIPLGGSRKGVLRRYINIAVVFLVSGLWHGASWNFVVWGGLHALFQIIGYLTRDLRESLCARFKINRSGTVHVWFQRLFVFFLTSFAWIYFRAPSLRDALLFIKRIPVFNPWVLFDASLFHIGLSGGEWVLLIFLLAIFFAVSLCRERGVTCRDIVRQHPVIRVLIFWFLLFSVLILGIYGGEYSASAFIYAGF